MSTQELHLKNRYFVIRQVGDSRFERERAYKLKVQQEGVGVLKKGPNTVSSTFDAFQRVAAGLEGRTLAEKMADPNRPTWEQYKKDNEDKLDNVGGEARKMMEYRAELDRERDRKLSQAGDPKKSTNAISDDSDDDSDGESRDSTSEKKKKSKKEKKKHKKEKKKSKVAYIASSLLIRYNYTTN